MSSSGSCKTFAINSYIYSEQIEKAKRAKVYRRLARIVHPDKNTHKFSKEAFQKLSSSLRLLKLSLAFGGIFFD